MDSKANWLIDCFAISMLCTMELFPMVDLDQNNIVVFISSTFLEPYRVTTCEFFGDVQK